MELIGYSESSCGIIIGHTENYAIQLTCSGILVILLMIILFFLLSILIYFLKIWVKEILKAKQLHKKEHKR